MATKLKNIPSVEDLCTAYHCITVKDHGGLLSHHHGKLIPKYFYYEKSPQFVDLFMQECALYFAREENGGRLIKLKGKYYQEEKLVWLYYKGVYPQNALLHKDGDRMNCDIKNLQLTGVASIIQSSSGVPGVYKMTTGVNAYMWRAVYIENQYEERAVDADGKPLSKEDISWKTRGWHMRKTKIINKRNQKHIGYYLTKEKAIKALKLYTNEIKHPICRYRTDIKIKRLCLTLKGMYPNDASAAVWHYIQILYNRKAIDEAEALFYMEMLGHDNKVLMLREDG